MSEKTCKTCVHYHPLAATAHTLGMPPHGQCRERIHAVGVPVPHPNGSIDIAMRVLYPHVPEAMDACGQHREKGEVANG